jgi:hypothetical protein
MEKLELLSNKLKNCYQQKVPFVEDYVRLSSSDRNLLCADLRDEFKKYLYSDELRFSNIIRQEAERVKSSSY